MVVRFTCFLARARNCYITAHHSSPSPSWRPTPTVTTFASLSSRSRSPRYDILILGPPAFHSSPATLLLLLLQLLLLLFFSLSLFFLKLPLTTTLFFYSFFFFFFIRSWLIFMSTDWLLCRKCWIGHFATTQEVHQPLTKLDGIVAKVLKLPLLSLSFFILYLSPSISLWCLPCIYLFIYLAIYLLLLLTNLILPLTYFFSLSFFLLPLHQDKEGREEKKKQKKK